MGVRPKLIQAGLALSALALPMAGLAQQPAARPASAAASAGGPPRGAVVTTAAANTAANAVANAAGAQPRASASAPGNAMERAQRAADSPLRAILDAAKVQRRIDPEALGAVEAGPAAARRAVAPRAAIGQNGNAGGAGNAAGAQNAVANVAGQTAAASTAQSPAPNATGANGGTDESAVRAIRTLPAGTATTATPRAAALEPLRIAPLGGAAPQVPAAALPRLSGPPNAARPQLAHMVEPEVGPRLLELLARPEVTVEFTILADGSVSGVRVLPPVARQMVAPITAAVEQWRYAPLAAPQQHRVQLIFKNGN